MTKEQAEQRVEELQKAIEHSIANHNGLIGRLAEAQHFLKMCDECNLENAELLAEA